MLSDCAEDALMAPYPERTLEESLAGTGLRRFVGHWREQPAQDETAGAYEGCEPAVAAPRRWGLSAEAVGPLGDHLSPVWRRLRGWFSTPSADNTAHAYDYLRSPLSKDPQREL